MRLSCSSMIGKLTVCALFFNYILNDVPELGIDLNNLSVGFITFMLLNYELLTKPPVCLFTFSLLNFNLNSIYLLLLEGCDIISTRLDLFFFLMKS